MQKAICQHGINTSEEALSRWDQLDEKFWSEGKPRCPHQLNIPWASVENLPPVSCPYFLEQITLSASSEEK